MINPFMIIRRTLFSSDSKKIRSFLDKAERVIQLSKEIENRKKDMMEMEYKILTENKDDVFISLNDFMSILESPSVSMEEILKKCRHRNELSSSTSTLSIDAYVDNNHLVFCMDRDNCDKHKLETPNKINLITLRTPK